jgi:hypothetical protein
MCGLGVLSLLVMSVFGFHVSCSRSFCVVCFLVQCWFSGLWFCDVFHGEFSDTFGFPVSVWRGYLLVGLFDLGCSVLSVGVSIVSVGTVYGRAGVWFRYQAEQHKVGLVGRSGVSGGSPGS